MQLYGIFPGYCTTIDWLDYQRAETIVVFLLYPVYGSHAHSHSGPNLWIYKSLLNSTRSELLFAYFIYLYGFLQKCELYGF